MLRMSEDSSGGVRSSVSRTASTIASTGSASASRASSVVIVTVLGSPVTSSRPRSSAVSCGSTGPAAPIASLTSSAVGWPIARLCSRRT